MLGRVIRIGLVAVLVVSCTSGDNKAAPTVEAAPAKVAPWSKRETADCPAYPGRASVTVADVEGGYTVTITTTDETAVRDIREHARYVEAASAANAGAAALTFDRRMGDRTANCPVILDGTKVSVAERDAGVVITVAAKDPKTIAALRVEAKEKAETLAIMREAMKDAMK